MTWPVTGLFTSHWQSAGNNPPIDWPSVKAAGYTYAWIKATDHHDGRPITDPAFERDWELAQASGLFVGSMLYHRPSVPPDQQADHHVAVLAQAGYGQLPHMLDVEEEPDPDRSLYDDLSHLIRDLSRSPIGHVALYANLGFLQRFDLHRLIQPPNSLSVASWSRFKRAPSLPPGVTTWHDWQWSCRGNRPFYPTVPGIRGAVCLHRFNGTPDEFLAWIQQASIPPPRFTVSLTEPERAALLSIAGKLAPP